MCVSGGGGGGEVTYRDGGGDCVYERQTDRQKDRQTDRQTDRRRQRQTYRQTSRNTESKGFGLFWSEVNQGGKM